MLIPAAPKTIGSTYHGRVMPGSSDSQAEHAADAAATVVERYFAAVDASDIDAILADLADDAVWSWPGSGEVIRGRAAIEAVVRATPVLPRVLLHRIAAGPGVVTAIWSADYGDGTPWRNMTLFELRDGRIVGKTDLFGAAFEPPAWRRALVEVEPLPAP
jgi:ketosteroid isomerase-like protein